MQLPENDVPGPQRDFVGYGRSLPRVVWPNGATVALSVCVNYEEGSEPSHPDGDGRNAGFAEIPYPLDPAVRDLTAESGYEYGSRVGSWRIARALDTAGVRATFLACAVALERNSEVAAYIRERGHEPCCHGWRWEEVFRLTREEEREHMLAAIVSIRETCGERPVGWYLRATPSAHTRELLVEEGGFLYDSDAYNDDLPYFAEVAGKQHLVVPYSFVYNDARFVLAPGYARPDDFTDLCSRGLAQLRREGQQGFPKLMSVGVHPRWIGQAGRIDALARFLEEARTHGDVWIATRREIAEWWIAHHGEFERRAAPGPPSGQPLARC